MPGRAREGSIAEGLGGDGGSPFPELDTGPGSGALLEAWRGTKQLCGEAVSGRGSRRVRQVRQREREKRGGRITREKRGGDAGAGARGKIRQQQGRAG